MKARVRFAITNEHGGNGGRGSMMVSSDDYTQLCVDVVDRLKNSGILRAGEGVKLAITPLPERSTEKQQVAAAALVGGAMHEAF